jgi:MFS family permease
MNYFKFFKQFPAYLLFGLTVKFFSSPGQTFFLSMYSGHFKDSLGMGDSFYNIFYASATLLSAVTINFAGPLLDRCSSLRGVRIVGGCLALATFLMCFTYWTPLWCLTLFLVRFLGQGMMGLSAQTAMVRWFHSHRGKALGLTSIGFSLGEIIFPVVMPLLIQAGGWRLSWVAVSLLVLIVVVVLPPFFIPPQDRVMDRGEAEKVDSEYPADGPDQPAWTRGMVFSDPRFYLLMPSMMILPMVATGVILNQDGIAAWRGWDLGLMVRSFIGFGAGRLLFSLSAGPLVDRYSAVRMYSIFLLPVMVAIGLPLIHDGTWVPFMSYLLLGLGQGLAGVTGAALWPEIYGTRHIASIKSFANTFAIFSTALGPGIISLVLHFGAGFAHVLACFLALTVAAFVLGLIGISIHRRKST